LQTSQGYIIRILQHFATKLWNITNFVMLFQAVMKFLSRSKFSLLRKWSIPSHFTCCINLHQKHQRIQIDYIILVSRQISIARIKIL
jgi:valyl-tRNA synthetase